MRSIFSLFLCSSLFVLLTLAAAPASAQQPRAPRPIVLYVGQDEDLPRVAATIAVQKGFFADEGLSVELREGQFEQQLQPAKPASITVIGITSIFALLKARSAGKKIIAFASAYARSPIVFYARASAKVTSVADLADKTIGYEPGSDSALVFDAMLRRYGVSKSSMKEAPVPDGIQSLTSGKVDAMPGILGRDSIALKNAGFSFTQLDPNAFGLHVLGSVFVTDDATLRTTPSVVEGFLRGLLKGLETVFRNDPADRQLIADSIHASDLNQVVSLIDAQRPLLRPAGRRFAELDVTDVKQALVILEQQSPQKNSPRIDDIVNTDLLSDIYRAASARTPQPLAR